MQQHANCRAAIVGAAAVGGACTTEQWLLGPNDADDAPLVHANLEVPPPQTVIFCHDALARKLAFRHPQAL